MKVRGRGERLVLEFDRSEIRVLQAVMTMVEDLLADDSPDDDAVQRRLYPDAYPGDADAELEYRSLTESALRTLRTERFAACRADLATGGRVDLADEPTASRWIQMLNDLRLTLGTRLEVDDEPPAIEPDDPDAGLWALYGWLTQVQDTAVTALMR